MPLRYLFGPVGSDYADENLFGARRNGECLAFHPCDAPDIVIRNEDTWQRVLARLPAGWCPDFIALMLPYSAIPTCLWEAPIPLVGLAGDWHLLWHYYRYALPRCDMVVTDAWGAGLLKRLALPVVTGNLFGCALSFLGAPREGVRDIDVLYVGSLHPAEQRHRLPWLRQLAIRLGSRWNVVIRSGVARADYRRLLQRSRVVFNRSVRRECNLRVFEAASMGALLFQEAENEEVADYFRDGEECVFYTEETLWPRLDNYLSDEIERRRLANAAARRVSDFAFSALWNGIVSLVARHWSDLTEAARRRGSADVAQGRDAAGRLWELFCCHTATNSAPDTGPPLISELNRTISEQPTAQACALLGLVIARQAQREGAFDYTCVVRAAGLLRQAVELAPERPLLRLNLAEALWRAGEDADALDACRRAIALIENAGGLCEDDLNGGHFPPAYDTFRVEWERAAWTNAGRPRGEAHAKLVLLEWRLCSLVATLSGDLDYYRRAMALRDDLWSSRAALGRALLRAGDPRQAACHLRRAAELNPFDPVLADDVLIALRTCGDRQGEERFQAEWRLLCRAVPSGCPEVRFAQEVTR